MPTPTFFFSREQITTDILDRLRRGERMLALIGNSGVGKSSLVQAGVVAALRRQRWPGGDGRDWPSDLRDSRSWLVLTMKPGEAPVFELARVFVAQWTEPTDPARERLTGEWAVSLKETLGLPALLRATRDHFREGFGLPPPDRFVLVIDQAEELYTRAGEAEAHRFSEIVVAGLNDPLMSWLPRTPRGRATMSRNSPSAWIGSGAAAEWASSSLIGRCCGHATAEFVRRSSTA